MKFSIKTILRILFVLSCVNLQAINNQPKRTPRVPRNHTPQQQEQQLAAALNQQNIALLLQLAALVNQQNQQPQ